MMSVSVVCVIEVVNAAGIGVGVTVEVGVGVNSSSCFAVWVGDKVGRGGDTVTPVGAGI